MVLGIGNFLRKNVKFIEEIVAALAFNHAKTTFVGTHVACFFVAVYLFDAEALVVLDFIERIGEGIKEFLVIYAVGIDIYVS